jgi:sec-independent protein translocase protein TatB
MFGAGWTEMLIIGVVALVVIGPKDLPVVMSKLGRMVRTVRRMGDEFQRELNKTTGLDQIADLRRSITEPLRQTSDEIMKEFNRQTETGVEPTGIMKPTDPKVESVYDQIAATSGLPSEPFSAADQAEPLPAPAEAAPKPRRPRKARAPAAAEAVAATQAKTRRRIPRKAAPATVAAAPEPTPAPMAAVAPASPGTEKPAAKSAAAARKPTTPATKNGEASTSGNGAAAPAAAASARRPPRVKKAAAAKPAPPSPSHLPAEEA